MKILISNGELNWIDKNSEGNILEKVGLLEYSIKDPCQKRIKYIEKELNKLSAVFPDELKFIVQHTSRICWLEKYNDQFIGSAGFFEVPNCTFFSDAALFSIPPENVVPRAYASFAILENLYHESLHHQMHANFSSSAENYLINAQMATKEYSISWRTRKFTLLEAFHALHVYSSVTPLRFQFLEHLKLTKGSQEDCNLEWIHQSVLDGLKMWKDLLQLLMVSIHKFNSCWSQFIYLWQQQYYIFTSGTVKEISYGSQA